MLNPSHPSTLPCSRFKQERARLGLVRIVVASGGVHKGVPAAHALADSAPVDEPSILMIWACAENESAAAQTVSAPVMKEDDGGRIGTWVTITVAERGRAVAQSPDHGKGLAA
ncbi:hypothetical protein PQH03_27310 [Ralstonia insidiosa]|jgi:hypothetical protein|uniref:hypothetical protein n=1 Tax=Burkholderiales TaxID=80840 RepID=UPI0011DCAE1B|nr:MULTISPECIES: hypothetical protein [Burkholderiales]MBU0914769.1 hypothetical protein [Gammaproteobacteria bacterium]MBA9921752.1 hypothetical protein [Ralstonia pickettii]MBX3901969.1 hypothetical protein [Ralstonia insidiosa]MBY4912871.1 hypothetical protein [Ralstonia insidiosa]MDE4928354.1 hypothetical protein [Ralstonia insidiosa]